MAEVGNNTFGNYVGNTFSTYNSVKVVFYWVNKSWLIGKFSREQILM